MQCQTCGYRLWNLTARRCPECGTEFRPSEFEFVPGSIQFSCPHCQQSYYGTGARGHLVPMEFDCVQCGRHIHMDEMVLLPTEGLQEEQTLVDIVPWLERKKYGPVKAWFAMLGRALVGPTRLMRALPMHCSTAPAWWFTILTQLLIYCFILFPFFLIGFFAGGRAVAMVSGVLGLFMGGFVAAAFVFTFLWGLIAHGMLRLTGPTASTIGRTYQAICYSSGALAVTAVPCLGAYLLWAGYIWWIISAILMVAEGQKVHAGRAALAVLTAPGLAIVLAIVAGGLAWSNINPRMRGPTFMTARATAQTSQVLMALQTHAAQNSDQWPAHAIELIAGGGVSSSVFITAFDASTSDVPVADSTLTDFDMLSDERRPALVQAAVAALPKNVVAHRLGDFVFTYHRIPRTDLQQPFWLVVYWPENKTPGQWAVGPIIVGLLDGTTTSYKPEEFQKRLDEQNRLRVDNGLPKLISPSLVTHTQPTDAALFDDSQ